MRRLAPRARTRRFLLTCRAGRGGAITGAGGGLPVWFLTRGSRDTEKARQAVRAIRDMRKGSHWAAESKRADQRRPPLSAVIDASITLSWYFEDEITAAADAVLTRVGVECACALDLAVRSGECAHGCDKAKRIDAEFREQVLARLGQLDIAIDPDGDTHAWSTTLRISTGMSYRIRCGLSGIGPTPSHRAGDS
jgi:hypothetical protein